MINALKLAVSLFIIAVFTVACSHLDVQILNQRAAELMQQGDIEGAIARLESIKDLNPNFPQTRYNLAIAYLEKEEFDKSIEEFKKAIELKKDFADAHYSIAVIFENKALQEFEKEKEEKI